VVRPCGTLVQECGCVVVYDQVFLVRDDDGDSWEKVMFAPLAWICRLVLEAGHRLILSGGYLCECNYSRQVGANPTGYFGLLVEFICIYYGDIQKGLEDMLLLLFSWCNDHELFHFVFVVYILPRGPTVMFCVCRSWLPKYTSASRSASTLNYAGIDSLSYGVSVS
jgi:hypothetical protein